jgi:hypothetical protein
VIDREREEIDIGGKTVIWDGRDSDMEMGRETAGVVFGGKSINVYNKVQCKHIVHCTELYVMLLNDPLCTIPPIKKLSGYGGFILCARQSVVNIGAPTSWRYMFHTKRQKCVNLRTMYEHSHGQLENDK